MKRILKRLTGIFLGILLLSLVGCQGMDITGTSKPDEENVTTIADKVNENNIDNPKTSIEETTDDTDDNEDIENPKEGEDGSEDVGEDEPDESGEAEPTPEEKALQSYEYWDKYCNYNSLDLTPMEGEFMALDPESDDPFPYIDSEDGDVYGFYDDLTDGCSVWCAIDYDSYINEISATSTLAPQGSNSYEASNLGNGKRENAWVEGAEGYGIGESVTIVRNYSHGGDAVGFVDYGYDSFFFPTLCIVNGMAKNETAWKNNSRVKSLKLYFNDEYVATLELEDSMKPQFISLSGLHLSARDKEDSTFRFEIAEVYPGDKYEDTALTGIEIEIFTENH